MYRHPVDQATRNDIAAAAAAHCELGRDYDYAFAESLVDRIGAEIDKRVEASLGARSSGSRSAAATSQSVRSQALVLTGVAAGAGVTGLVAILANVGQDPAIAKSILITWVILAVIVLAGVLVRKYGGPKRG
jgi:hypothetical protein